MAEGAELRGRRIAVTGAGGFIGVALCRRLAGAGAGVAGIDSDPAARPRIEAAGATAVAADVTDRDACVRALEGADAVVHAAALVREHGRMEEFVRVNVGGTVAVLDAAAAAGAGRVVHVSSVVVYGYDAPGELDEDAPRRACGIPYIDTKSASDRIACDRGAVVVRPGDVYGPASEQWVLRPLRLAQARQLAVPAPGDGLMLPVYVDDLVSAILLALERGEPGRAYTAWSGERVTFGDYFDRIARLGGMRAARRLPRGLLALAALGMEAYAALRRRPPAFSRRAITFVSRRGTVSNRRAVEELGWKPEVDLAQGLERTEAWLRGEGLVA